MSSYYLVIILYLNLIWGVYVLKEILYKIISLELIKLIDQF